MKLKKYEDFLEERVAYLAKENARLSSKNEYLKRECGYKADAISNLMENGGQFVLPKIEPLTPNVEIKPLVWPSFLKKEKKSTLPKMKKTTCGVPHTVVEENGKFGADVSICTKCGHKFISKETADTYEGGLEIAKAYEDFGFGIKQVPSCDFCP